MKTVSLTIIALLSYLNIIAYNVEISGIVTDVNTQQPVANHIIEIAIDSVGGFTYYSLVTTNENGFYTDTIQLAGGITIGSLYVATDSCNTIISRNFEFSQGNTSFFVPFIVCDSAPSECQAYYLWEKSNILPRTINFIDLSVGDISNWFWNFGDGTSSSDQNPQHSYESFGSYNVSLTITTIDSCFSTYGEIINIYEDSVNCNASFTYHLDTLNNTPNTYFFTDQSSSNIAYWLWDFGDGNFSYQQNPIHTYSESGNYNVCLMVGTNDGNQYCADDTCSIISTMDYFYFGGQIFAGNYPINIDSLDYENVAKVSLYRKIDNSWYFMDEGEFWKYGYYWFYDKPKGEYMVFAELSENSLIYSDYSPSYYPNSINWKSSSTFILNSNDSYAINISLRSLAYSDIGIGVIDGAVYGDLSCNSIEDLDLKNVFIQLLNSDGSIIDFTKPDTAGHYSFNNIANGNYSIKAEYPGKYTETYSIKIDDNTKYINQDLMVYCHNILGVTENQHFETFKVVDVFPNPATKYFSLDIDSDTDTTIEIHLININGQILKEFDKNIIFGRNNLSFDIALMSEGYYIIKVIDKTSNYQAFKNLIIIN